MPELLLFLLNLYTLGPECLLTKAFSKNSEPYLMIVFPNAGYTLEEEEKTLKGHLGLLAFQIHGYNRC